MNEPRAASTPLPDLRGTLHTLRWNSAVRYASDGQTVVATIAQGQDITECKRKEAANGAKRVFPARMCHELRTPLNAILGFSKLMSCDRTLSRTQAENLAIINRSGGRLLGLINAVLDMAKIEAGHAELQEHDFDLHQLLVVEDRAEGRKLLADLLTELGFAVRTAKNGAEAVAVWHEWQPHLIWMDMRMPVMDGHEATRRIKATAQGQQTVIVAVSASVLSDEHAAVRADGCDDFVRKPYREEEIVACLVKHLGVQMIYANDAPPVIPVAAPPAFDLTGLPAAWAEQVCRAAVAADAAQLLALAATVEVVQPALADALRTWVDQFDYGAVLTAVAS